MTYARARLLLGIVGVGVFVVLSALLLALRVPARVLPMQTDLRGGDALVLAGLVAVYIALCAPLDLFGGWILPREYGRTTEPPGRFLGRWLRGAILHGGALWLIALALLSAARAGGIAGALLAFLGATLALLLLQPPLAVLVGGLRLRDTDEPGVLSLQGGGHYVTGGIVGLPGCERILVPDGWKERLSAEALAALLTRRREVIRGGLRLRGLGLALGWNVSGFALALWLAGGADSVARLVTTALGFTLWSFLGLLVLPAPSQQGVFAGDRAAIRCGVEAQALQEALGALDADQDDEPSRSPLIERYFHPLPSLERRLERLERAEGPEPAGAWHGARMAIYLSWAGLSLLSRAVHCNSGRPDVWVLLPGD